MQPITDPLVSRLTAVAPLTPEQVSAARSIQGRVRTFPARATIKIENEPVAAAFAIREGWAFAYETLPSGERQVVDFLLPGDVIGLGNLFLKFADHTYMTVTETELVEIPASAVRWACRRSPELVDAFFVLVLTERAKLVEHLIDLGRRDSTARVAHLLLEFGYRLRRVGRGSSCGYACPLNQYLLADALGLTAIHVNRVLRKLRLSGLLTFRHGQVTFHDVEGLIRLTGFDPAYLDRNLAAQALFVGVPQSNGVAAAAHRRSG